jgi:pSer/pThr/pTyr-binding forkhead associated (FHA) protein
MAKDDAGAPTKVWEALPPELERKEVTDLRTSGAQISVRRPGVPEVRITLDRSEFVIGRQPTEVDLVLDDEWVSRRHARLWLDEKGYFRLEDLGSQNGIDFAGRPVRRLNLVDGDVFGIGRTEFTFHADMSRRGAPPASIPPPRAPSQVAEPPEPDSALIRAIEGEEESED